MVVLLYRAETVGPVCQRVAKASNGQIKAVRDTEPCPKTDVLVRWGSLGVAGARIIVNTPDAVALAKNKHKTREVLKGICPQTWFTIGELKYPCVIRPKKHHAAKKFFVCRNVAQAKEATRKCKLGWYGSELINKAAEYRVFVLHGRAVCVSQRFPAHAGDVAWNLAAGGKLINVKFKGWPIEAIKASIEAMNRLGLDWGAVDVAIDKDGKPVVFEVNTAPGLRNPYTISRIASALVWTASNPIPKVVKGDKWQNLIHPAFKE